jgi:hypothetical protein
MDRFKIGQQVRITAYSHPHCGEFGTVRSLLSEGEAGVLTLLRFKGKLVAAMASQCIHTPGETFDDGSVRSRSTDTGVPEFSRASHYS